MFATSSIKYDFVLRSLSSTNRAPIVSSVSLTLTWWKSFSNFGVVWTSLATVVYAVWGKITKSTE